MGWDESEDKGTFGVEGRLDSVMFDPTIPICSKVVKSNGVRIWVEKVEKLVFEFNALRWIHFAFKD